VRVPNSAIFGGEDTGLQVTQHFFNENRIRQAASSLGAAEFCIDKSVEYAKVRAPFGKPLSQNQAIQFPLVELQTQCEMLRALIHKTRWGMDSYGAVLAVRQGVDVQLLANRLCCEAADRAMQVHGGLGYSRHTPFEHIYRHHRRYRITEGAEEIQMRGWPATCSDSCARTEPKGVTRTAMITDDELSAGPALAGALEPVAGQVYFSPECHEGYTGLGVSPSAGKFGDVPPPTVPPTTLQPGLGHGPGAGRVVSAAFAVFNPAVVVPLVSYGWDADRRGHDLRRPHAGARSASWPASSAPSPTGWPGRTTCWPGPSEPLRPEGGRCTPVLASRGPARRAAGRRLAAGRHAAGVPGRRPRLRLDDRRARRHRDRGCHRAVLGPAAAHLHPDPVVVRRRARTRPRPGWPSGAGGRRGVHARGAGRARGRRAATDRQCRPIVEALGDDLDDLLAILLRGAGDRAPTATRPRAPTTWPAFGTGGEVAT
jgi:hypothetical protein